MATFYFNAAQDNEWTSLASYATGTISFSGQPADSESVYIDGINVFEFDSDSAVNQGTAVVIGGTLADTLANLAAAIEAAAIGISATVNGTDIDLVATSAGPNPFVYSDSSVVTTADMTGGATGNWWTDADCTVQATSLPTSADDVVVKPLLNGYGFHTNSGSAPTIASLSSEAASLGIYIDMTITGDAGTVYEIYGNITVTVGSVVIAYSNSATVIGNVTFKGAENYSPYGNFGTVDGNATFDEYSTNSATGIVTGDATFNEFSTQFGTVGGNATFNGSTQLVIYSNTSYGGNLTFSESAAENTLAGFIANGFLGITLSGSVDVDATNVIQLRGVNGSSILGVV
jgi:hypothetical protein